MKTYGLSMEPETVRESDALSIFKSTVESECRGIYSRFISFGEVMVTIPPEVKAELEDMYAELNSIGEDTIGDGLHWGDGEMVMNYFSILN